MKRNYYPMDILASVMVVLIGASEAANLAGVLLRLSLPLCAAVLAFLLAVGLSVLMFAVVLSGRQNEARSVPGALGGEEWMLVVSFVILAGAQAGYILLRGNVWRQGDMTVEIVGSFLRTDGLYRVNPLTGRADGDGMPLRFKVLCLPALYASICRFFPIAPAVLVHKVMPVVTLLCGYAAYACLGKCLFPEERKKRLLFLVCTALVFWAGTYAAGMDGFGLLAGGWRGVVIRNLVLIPYAVSLCLRKKYLHAALCCMAETCIVWTAFGLGACAVTVAGLAVAAGVRTFVGSGKEDAVG